MIPSRPNPKDFILCKWGHLLILQEDFGKALCAYHHALRFVFARFFVWIGWIHATFFSSFSISPDMAEAREAMERLEFQLGTGSRLGLSSSSARSQPQPPSHQQQHRRMIAPPVTAISFSASTPSSPMAVVRGGRR